MKYKLFFLAILTHSLISAQNTKKRALFIGNSYIYYNDLPKMISDAALSVKDTLIFDSNTPGGTRLLSHLSNATTLSKIGVGNWDFVILQEQSQYPSFSENQVKTDVFPYARLLDSIINAKNPCAETVFYMTWGRKNGDASNCPNWPPVCTYAGMDSLLNLRYRIMAKENKAILSPVGQVWKYLRANFPSIELYNTDESHPSAAGSYAAACSFYTVMFRKNPALITFNSTLSAQDAEKIRNAAKLVVYDSLLKLHVGEYDLKAKFGFSNAGSKKVLFTNNSISANSYSWDFGDGNTSIDANPTHTCQNAGEYKVKLSVTKCGQTDSIAQTINVTNTSNQTQTEKKPVFTIYPNPIKSELNVNTTKLVGEKYEIYNSLGKLILAGELVSNDTKIPIENLARGSYFIKIAGKIESFLKD